MNDDDLNASPLGEFVFNTCGDAMYGYVLTRVNFDHDIADDIRADALLRIVKTPTEPASRTGPMFKSWVFAITKRATADYFRKRQQRMEVPFSRLPIHTSQTDDDQSIPEMRADQTDIVEQVSDREPLLRALLKISVRERFIINRRAEGYDNGEIATKLNIKGKDAHKEVSRIYKKALRKLKRLMAEEDANEPGGT